MFLRLLAVFLVHILSLAVLLFLSPAYKGPVVAKLGQRIQLRALDLTAVGLIILGTLLLNYWSWQCVNKQKKQPPKEE